ncbi:hypothetical protein BH20ACT3_BH20ACT3_03650 [soil metagenome]
MRGQGQHTTDGVDREIRDLTDQQRAADAAEARRREHWLRLQASEEGTFDGVLLDLGEREQLLAVSTVTGRVLRGVVRTIGVDFVGLRAPSGEGALVPLRSLTTVRPEPGSRPTVGDRLVQMDASLASVLSNLAPERPWMSVHTLGGDGFAGALQGVGQDLLVLKGPSGDETYVPLYAIGDVMLP